MPDYEETIYQERLRRQRVIEYIEKMIAARSETFAGALEEKEKLEDIVKKISVVELAFLTLLAVIKDFSEMIFALFSAVLAVIPGLGLIGPIVAKIISLLFGIFFFIWTYVRFKGTFFTRMFVRIFLVWFLETFVPIWGEIMPTWTGFMLYLWWLRRKSEV